MFHILSYDSIHNTTAFMHHFFPFQEGNSKLCQLALLTVSDVRPQDKGEFALLVRTVKGVAESVLHLEVVGDYVPPPETSSSSSLLSVVLFLPNLCIIILPVVFFNALWPQNFKKFEHVRYFCSYKCDSVKSKKFFEVFIFANCSSKARSFVIIVVFYN